MCRGSATHLKTGSVIYSLRCLEVGFGAAPAIPDNIRHVYADEPVSEFAHRPRQMDDDAPEPVVTRTGSVADAWAKIVDSAKDMYNAAQFESPETRALAYCFPLLGATGVLLLNLVLTYSMAPWFTIMSLTGCACNAISLCMGRRASSRDRAQLLFYEIGVAVLLGDYLLCLAEFWFGPLHRALALLQLGLRVVWNGGSALRWVFGNFAFA